MKLESTEIEEGVVFESGDVRVAAFEVDHGGEQLDAFGYRIDFQGHSAVLSGDTTFNENLIAHSQNVDLLVHEITHGMGPGASSAPTWRGSGGTTPYRKTPASSSPAPSPSWPSTRISCCSARRPRATWVSATRATYNGPLFVGEDLMQFDIGDEVRCNRFAPSA